MADFDNWLWGLGQTESSNNYGALGPTTKRGDRAYGRYQVMGSNVPAWTKQALGKSLTPQEFLASPEAQDAVAKTIAGGYFDKYGPAGAANMWFTGRPNPSANASDGYLTAPAYVGRVLANMQKAGGGNAPEPTNVAVGGGEGSDQMAGGPMGDQMRPQGYNPGTSDWSSALQGAGAALAGISNPAQGAALASMANQAADRQLQAYQLSKPQYQTMQDGSIVQINPRTGQVTPVYQGARKLEAVKDQNLFGETNTRFVDPFTGQTVNGGGGGGGQGNNQVLTSDLFNRVTSARDAGANQDQLLQMVPAELRDYTRAVIEGREPPSSLSRNGGLKAGATTLAQTIEPGTDANTFYERRKLRTEFASLSPNTLGGQMASAGTLARHAGEGPSIYDQLPNGQVPIWNAAKNAFEENTGSAAQNRFATWANNYGNEKARYLSGKAPSDAARGEALAPFRQSNSPGAFRAALATDASMFEDKHEELKGRWSSIMKNTPMPESGGLMSKDAVDTLDRLKQLDPRQATPAASPQSSGSGVIKFGRDKSGKIVPITTQQANPNGA